MPSIDYRFHVAVHARPVGPAEVDSGCAVGLEVPCLAVRPGDLFTPFPRTFEQVAAALDDLPRLHLEPDGSFVWGEGAGADRWQIDGHLFDRHGRLLYVELKGGCPAGEFDLLLAAWGWPAQPLMFQLQPQAYVLSESAFRQHASRPSSG